ncbi:siderophore ABC transporter substrate-binding protein [Haemophilus sputorum]|uniref:Siderophore ABC transporter substrate-binding protein n=1 Tax=Haemophilus sputorum TaxID=1078480 RepID=A0A369YIT9_9PAST|nr:siderophore ABC transporter substrate-binding protein [Haemophilus sputorum]RDE73150.1 siderophore ABC transporter substrate-binding protein [Haemophilus sputorum]
MFKKALFTLTLAATLTSNSFAKEVTIPTARGEVTFAQTPTKVAVFEAAAIDSLAHLGVPMIGTADVAKTLPFLRPITEKTEVIGTVFEPNYEVLNRLHPDLIIVGSRAAKKFDELNGIAKTIDVTAPADVNTLQAGLDNIKTFGQLFDKEAEAAKLVTELETLINETKTAVKDKGNGLIILVNGGKISAFGDKGRLGWVHSALEIPMAAKDIATKGTGHGEPASFEFIQKVNPDWLFVLDRTAAIGQEGKLAKEVLDNELVHQTKAWKNNQIIYLSSSAYLAAGSVEQMREDLTNIKQAFSR